MLQTILIVVILLVVLLLWTKLAAIHAKVFEVRQQFGLAVDGDGVGITSSDVWMMRKMLLGLVDREGLSDDQADALAKYMGLDARDMEHAHYQVGLIRGGMDPVLAKFGTLNFRKLCNFPFDTMTPNDTFLAQCLVTEAYTGKKKNFIWF